MEMAVTTFDTLKFANTLKAAGVPDKQAEAQAMAFTEVVQANLKDLVTKDDLKFELRDLDQRLSSKMEALGFKSSNDLESTRLKLAHDIGLVRWMLGVMIAVNLTAIGLLIRFLFSSR